MVDISKSSGRSILDHFMSLRKIILDDDDILISQQFQLFVYFFLLEFSSAHGYFTCFFFKIQEIIQKQYGYTYFGVAFE